MAIAAASQRRARRRGDTGVPVLSAGFRPFFLAGGVWALVAMGMWVGMFTGELALRSHLDPIAWHVHEFLFGYTAAVIVGFLLTAIPNWTGRLPISGVPLLALLLLWLVGRVALLASDVIGPRPAVLLDGTFLVAFACVVLREIVAGRNWRNLKVGVVVLGLASANIAFHIEYLTGGGGSYATRAALSLIVLLISLIGGRIVPSFTRNWMVKQGAAALPRPFGPFDVFVLVATGVSLLVWVLFPDSPGTGFALVLAAVAQALRLARWSGVRTVREPLVLVLHGGYAFVPLGFALVGAAVLLPETIAVSAALHAWTSGAIGVMTLAVMTRAIRGHSGRDLTAPPTTQAIYGLAALSAILRLATLALPDMALGLHVLASIAWMAGFTVFLLVYGPMLWGAAKPKAAPAP